MDPVLKSIWRHARRDRSAAELRLEDVVTRLCRGLVVLGRGDRRSLRHLLVARPGPLLDAACDEIEGLRAEVARLRAPLAPVLRWAETVLAQRDAEGEGPAPDRAIVVDLNGVRVTVGDLRALARAAQGQGQAPQSDERERAARIIAERDAALDCRIARPDGPGCGTCCTCLGHAVSVAAAAEKAAYLRGRSEAIDDEAGFIRTAIYSIMRRPRSAEEDPTQKPRAAEAEHVANAVSRLWREHRTAAFSACQTNPRTDADRVAIAQVIDATRSQMKEKP